MIISIKKCPHCKSDLTISDVKFSDMKFSYTVMSCEDKLIYDSRFRFIYFDHNKNYPMLEVNKNDNSLNIVFGKTVCKITNIEKIDDDLICSINKNLIFL